MALSREDNHDVKKALGTAIAKKVATATRDHGRVVKLTPLRGGAANDKVRETGNSKATHFAPATQHDGYGWKEGYKHKGLGSS